VVNHELLFQQKATVLHRAADKGHLEAVKALVELRASINAVDVSDVREDPDG
jgi:ankyrin repeat protein